MAYSGTETTWTFVYKELAARTDQNIARILLFLDDLYRGVGRVRLGCTPYPHAIGRVSEGILPQDVFFLKNACGCKYYMYTVKVEMFVLNLLRNFCESNKVATLIPVNLKEMQPLLLPCLQYRTPSGIISPNAQECL